MKTKEKNMIPSNQDASLMRRGTSKKNISRPKNSSIELDEIKLPDCIGDNVSSVHMCDAQTDKSESAEDEEQEYFYDGIMKEIPNVRQAELEETEYSYEDTMEGIRDISPPVADEVEYTYDDFENEVRSTQYSVLEEERDYTYEDITSESEKQESNLDHKENNDMDESRINSGKMISDGEMGTYLMARKIIRKYGLKRLSKIGTTIWCFNGKSYIPLDDQKLGELIYSEIPETVKLEVSSCARIKKNVIEFIRDELAQAIKQGNRNFYFSREDYKDIMGKVVLKNGVFDIQSGLLEGFDATKPYYYELNADYLEVHDDRLYTPAFDKLISDACGGDRESIQMIIQVFGMLLMPDPCKKFPVVGPASNSGKSVLFGGLLEEVLPRARISHIATSELKDKFALGNAEDLLLISCMDVDMNTISAATAGVIKRATGEEVISVQDKYKPRKDIEVRFKFVFGTNGEFCTQRNDDGWQNRILAVPFIHETPEEEMDMHLLDKLLEEKDAIVTKVLRAMASAITEEGELQMKESELSIKLKYSWTMPNTCFDEFMGKMVEITGAEEDNYSTDELYEAYCRYYICSVRQNREHHNNVRLPQKEFVSNVLKYGHGLIEKKRMSRSRKERFDNAQHRMCGLLLKSVDIFDNDDRRGSDS